MGGDDRNDQWHADVDTLAHSSHGASRGYLPRRRKRRGHLLTQIKGRLSGLDRKSNGPIALAFAGANGVRNVAHFLSDALWDDQEMLGESRQEIGECFFEPEGMTSASSFSFVASLATCAVAS